MVKEIVKEWIDELIKKHNAKELKDLPKSIIDSEINDAKGTISNCTMQGTIQVEELRIACNKYYIECLEGALNKKLQSTKQFIIKIIDGDVYINDTLHYFDNKMDKNDEKVDLDKKVILALANEMGYEPTFLFEEMADRLNEMIDELDSESSN